MLRDNPFIHQAGLGSSIRRDICLVYEDHADLTVYVLQNYMNIDIFLQFLVKTIGTWIEDRGNI